MKRIYFISVAFIIILLSCEADKKKAIDNPYFSLKYDESKWHPISLYGNYVYLSSLSVDSNHLFFISFYANAFENIGNKRIIDYFNQVIILDMKDAFRDIEIKSFIEKDNQIIVEYTAYDGNHKFKARVIYIKSGHLIFSNGYTASIDKFDEYLPEAEEMFKSFEIK
jgi:hypothetical protein